MPKHTSITLMNTMLEKSMKRNSIEFRICSKRSLKNKLLYFLTEAIKTNEWGLKWFAQVSRMLEN